MNDKTLIASVAHFGNYLVIIAIVLELCFFCSIDTIVGCGMTAICWVLFRYVGLDEENITEHPFPWLIFFSMSMYRILPLFATLMEWKPINYKFEMGCQTFVGETMLYLVSTLAFILACRYSSNGNIRNTLDHFGFYDTFTPAQLWVAGIIGVTLRIYFMYAGNPEEGDAGGRILMQFQLLQFTPLLLLFPLLYHYEEDNESNEENTECNLPHDDIPLFRADKYAIIYVGALFVLSIFGNSRNSMLEPIMTVVILWGLSAVKSRRNINDFINFRSFVLIGVPLFIIIPLLSNISTAMLVNRGIRAEVSAIELFQSTLSTLQDKDALKQYNQKNKVITTIGSKNEEGWSEEYVDNFALNRYCNMRITDVTLYYAKRVGYNNPKMKEDLLQRIFAQLPLPVFNFFHFDFQKNSTFNSRGDYLYSQTAGYGMGGYRVTSHLGDGLATFGYWYFIIQFVLFFIEFKLVDCFSICDEKQNVHSLFGLIMVYSFVGMFRNANGMMGEIGYIVRGFWQQLFMLCLIIMMLKRIRIK